MSWKKAERKTDRLDELMEFYSSLSGEDKLEASRIREEYARVEGLIKEYTAAPNDKGILLGTMQGGKFTYFLPQWAKMLGCEAVDLLAVCRRMKEKGKLKYKEIHSPGNPDKGIKPISWKWYLRRDKREKHTGSGLHEGTADRGRSVLERFGAGDAYGDDDDGS